jgi:hypothetical protein
MQIWNFSGPTFKNSMPALLQSPIRDGCFLIDQSGGDNEEARQLQTAYHATDLPLIVGFTYTYEEDHAPRLARARQLLGAGGTVAAATSGWAEWSPLRPVQWWVDLCARHDLKWACSYIHVRLLEDLLTFKVRDELVKHDVPVFCLCGYMLARWALGETLPTYETALMGRKRSDFKLTPESLRTWLEPLRAFGGAGGQKGLDRGSIKSCEEVGFKGVVCTTPFEVPHIQSQPMLAARDSELYSDLVDTTWK